MSNSVNIFQIALTDIRPVKALMGIAATSINSASNVNNKELTNLHDIDVMLMDKFIEYVRKGTNADLKSFLDDMLSFIDSNTGDKLKDSPEGKRYFFRWEHFHDLCNIAVGNFDVQAIERFIASRKHAAKLMEILNNEREGVRANELAKKLDNMKNPQLSRLLNEAEDEELVIRERLNKKCTVVKLSPAGIAYMEEKALSTENVDSETQTNNDDNIHALFNADIPDGIPSKRKEVICGLSGERPMKHFSGVNV
ncbi:MAG: hypothetical protein ACUZ8H_00920 [Candidatus Anammoxibacter sp.]